MLLFLSRSEFMIVHFPNKLFLVLCRALAKKKIISCFNPFVFATKDPRRASFFCHPPLRHEPRSIQRGPDFGSQSDIQPFSEDQQPGDLRKDSWLAGGMPPLVPPSVDTEAATETVSICVPVDVGLPPPVKAVRTFFPDTFVLLLMHGHRSYD